MTTTQTNDHQISLLVAVTGHRDIVEIDIPKIRADICAQLVNIESNTIKQNVRPILLSGLAAGGDQLVAQEALKRNWDVFAVFPMPLSDFLEDFTSQKDREALMNLKAQCKQVIEIPWALSLDSDITDQRDQQYRNQSIFIVRQSQLVIALWDGTPANLSGSCGTAYAVELCRKGPPPVGGEVLAAPETTSLIHIPIRRQSDLKRAPIFEANPPSTDSIYINVCKEFGSYNKAAAKLIKTNPLKIKECADQLIPEELMQNLDLEIHELVGQYAVADALAQDRQTIRNRVVKVASIATILAAFAQGTNAMLSQTSWMIVYGVAAGLAYGLYLILFKLPYYRTEDRYLEYRALAEALRVQIFWRLAGLSEGTAEHYLQLVKSDVGWVREAARSISLPVSINSSNGTEALEIIDKFWINNQVRYFVGETPDVIDGAAMKCKKKQQQFDYSANLAMAFGVVSVVVGTVSAESICGISPDIKAGASAYATALFLCAGVIKAYATAMGYADQAVSYEKMGAIFQRAERLLEQDQRRQNECLLALGKHALAENAEWLLQHRRSAFKIPS